MPLSNGADFAGYRVIRMLGSGGMGEVYLVQHPRLPRRDALKLLPKEWSGDPQYRSRFSREADLASTLWHPSIVGVHDRGEHDGQLWIAMDFVDGQDLGLQLSEKYPAGIPSDQAIPIIAAVASALDHAHKRGLLHRDVKPANVMLAEDEDGDQRVLLADFGIARNVDDVSGLTTTNMTVGTVAYAAPEQLMGDEIDGRADQYALAATAFHLLTGAPLFPNSNPAVVISRHLNSPPPNLRDTHAHLAAFDPVLAKALSKSPSDRYSRCIDLVRALEGAAGTDAAARLAVAPTQPAPAQRKGAPVTPLPARHRSKQRLMVGFAAAVVLLAAGFLILWRPWNPPGSADIDSQRPADPLPPSTASSPASPNPVSSTAPLSTSSAAPPPPTTTELPAPRYPTAGALGSGCDPTTPVGTGSDGTLFYCARMQYTDGYYWSRTAEDIPNPDVTFAPPPPPSEVDPSGPKNGDRCTTPGVVTPGPWGLVECRDMSAWGLPGWFWGGPT